MARHSALDLVAAYGPRDDRVIDESGDTLGGQVEHRCTPTVRVAHRRSGSRLEPGWGLTVRLGDHFASVSIGRMGVGFPVDQRLSGESEPFSTSREPKSLRERM